MTKDERMTKSENQKARAEDSFWGANPASVVREEPETKRVYDLEERTARFGEAVIDFAKAIQQDAVTNRIISRRCRIKEGVLKKQWNLQERDTRSKALSTHGGSRDAILES